MTVDDIKSGLRELTTEELDEVKQHCEYLQNQVTTKSEGVEVSDFARSFYGILERICDRKGLRFVPSFSVFEWKYKKGIKAYVKQVDVLEEWMHDTFTFDERNDTAFVKRMLANIYIRHMQQEYPTKLNFHILINNIHRIPAIFNNQFPGYRESGLQDTIIKALREKNKNG